MGPNRHEILKFYVLALLSEGQLSFGDQPHQMVQKIVTLVQGDLRIVMKDIASLAAEQGLKHVATKVGGFLGVQLEAVAGDIAKRGFGAFWKDLQGLYHDGVNAKQGK